MGGHLAIKKKTKKEGCMAVKSDNHGKRLNRSGEKRDVLGFNALHGRKITWDYVCWKQTCQKTASLAFSDKKKKNRERGRKKEEEIA